MCEEPRPPSTGHRARGGSGSRAAILTPLGEGGIAILHVLGPAAVAVARQLFRPARGSFPQPDGRRLHYGHIVDDEEVVDEVLVRLVPAADAPGGESLVEVNCHGGVVAVQRVLECFVRRGAEAVEADALLDMQARSPIEAEARRALLAAATPLGVETLLDQLDGALERALHDLPWDRPQEAADAVRRLLATERLGQALWQPRRVALVGPANAGKSTLFNALAREDRMIVSPAPGTTRDAVSAEVALGGLPVWLTDTAGERAPSSAIEELAIARARAAAAEADVVLLVLDGAAPLPMPLGHLPRAFEGRQLVVVNKADLALASWTAAVSEACVVSALRGDHLDELAARVVEALVGQARYEPRRPVVFTARQAGLLEQALAALEAGDLGAARGHAADIPGRSAS